MSESHAWRTIGRMLIVTAVLFGGISTWVWLSDQSHHEQHTYWQPVSAVEVDSGDAAVRVAAGAADRVTVQESMEWAFRRPSVSLHLTGHTLKVGVQCRSPFGSVTCAVQLTVQVPAGTAVRTVSGSGRTELSGLSGAVRAQAGSGEVSLEGLSGPVWTQSTSGQITGTDLTSRQVQAAITSGRVQLGFSRPPDSVTATATSGTVVVTLPTGQGGYRVDGHVTSGTWSVDPSVVNSASSRTIDATATSGLVRVVPFQPDPGTDSGPDAQSAPPADPASGAPSPRSTATGG
ncbi:hypothetical protein CFP65_2291 [Kitasatospora sp. MMS16-BH015]|uniref:DUF4097 family beta strand repeat-containing protein n=1 Tax=Kitasatospora sp. MMS16-BH015 TaxID=2018025 RepID=UPI000CA2D9DA|nr:DUF4097 family beta strand repeat-containing protein [Kitasatospora sp. MMS16-BH015]AUG77131.1 hypothetical protein CFP65_2291 [Kitasatospora sp. MMS16-BH015]